MSDYKLTVGLEVHAELNTRTKMFCSSKNDPDEKRPNINVCPICMGHPGTLPTINMEAIRSVLRLGVAVGGSIADYSEFDRKNYFYPDIPKGYQISQYKHPLVSGGSIKGVPLTRIHLEEDTAKSTHPDGKQASNGAGDRNFSLVDFNRAGVPLLELVTEPEIHDPETAAAFARELQLLLVYLGISEANMEKGEMRVEANISVSKNDARGTKVEVKNLNSFKSVEKAIRFEMDRHIKLLEAGDKVVQETRGWDESNESTFSQRVKEESHDYRYFPDPDLPKLFISEIEDLSLESLKSSLPELPEEKRQRYKTDFGLRGEDIEIYVREAGWGTYLEEVVGALRDTSLAQLASNYILTDLEGTSIAAANFAKVIEMVSDGVISARGAKDLIKILEVEDGDPMQIAEKKNLIQKSDVGELKNIAQKIIDENNSAAEEYKNGKLSSLQYLIGQAMKESKGSANPQVIKNIFEELLK